MGRAYVCGERKGGYSACVTVHGFDGAGMALGKILRGKL